MNKVFKIALLVLFLYGITGMRLYAQQNHFVYIQSDDKVPFDVSVNGVTYNSSSIGYVIVPKLIKGNHQLNISFQNKKYPDQQFYCSIDKLDAGFLLKKYEDKGWGLFNLQSFDITIAGVGVLPVTQETVANSHAFGDMLSEVVNDSTLNSKTEPAEPKVQEAVILTDTTAAVKNETIAEQKANAVPINDVKADASSIIAIPATVAVAPIVAVDNVKASLFKIGESSTIDGRDMVFVDTNTGLNDTIRIFLPTQPAYMIENVEKKVAEPFIDTVKVDSAVNTAKDVIAVKEEVAIVNGQSSEVENPFFTKEHQKAEPKKGIEGNTTVIDSNKETVQATELSAISKPECKHVLSENDMDKFRKKMVSTGSDGKMIDVVRRGMQDKCITTDQVKNLGALFLSDDGRYSFFNAVYPLVSDTSAFSSLESQLIDPNYKKRFRDLLK
ncbi:hypothetical protein BH10BAC2_BH10BAC2_43790 [soil metagenome]